ncbi:GTPase HflX [Peptoniphilus sp.]|jgi:GTP-binding protein HflX|uniref:GTPase HflX n=1 Tax=Peptoniphilus sp. TaxID=1971214 RepID=UPI003D9291AA
MDNVFLENLNSQKKIEKVITVGTDLGAFPHSLETSMDELSELVRADGAEVVGEVTQNLVKFNPKYLIGSGKVQEIKDMAEKLEVDAIVFNDELSGIQVRNLEKKIKKKVVDRTNLILDIFGLRATTYEAKLQVELARLEYQMPRLLGIDGWSRTGGGIGTRGPGEQIIETDRRRLQREIDKIKEKLKKAEKTRDTTRNRRVNSNIPVVSLVGYTNAGKSTILNKLKMEDSKEVSVKNMLFETLDPSSRRARLPSGREFIISDTVGFVSKLPTKIVEAFKSTLEEIKYSDLILHVIDSSSEDIEIQYKTAISILKDIDVIDKNIITVFNKSDKINIEDINLPREIAPEKQIFISAFNDEDIERLLQKIEDNLEENYVDVKLKFPYDDTEKLFELVEKFDVVPNYEDDGIYIDLSLRQDELQGVKEYMTNV